MDNSKNPIQIFNLNF